MGYSLLWRLSGSEIAGATFRLARLVILLDPMRLRVLLGVLLVLGCGGGGDERPASPDATVAAGPWNDRQKCEHMCQAYCVHKSMCDGSEVADCREALDESDGGTCAERAELFAEITQQRVEACIAVVEAMSCPAFLHMYNYGTGVPSECNGILR